MFAPVHLTTISITALITILILKVFVKSAFGEVGTTVVGVVGIEATVEGRTEDGTDCFKVEEGVDVVVVGYGVVCVLFVDEETAVAALVGGEDWVEGALVEVWVDEGIVPVGKGVVFWAMTLASGKNLIGEAYD